MPTGYDGTSTWHDGPANATRRHDDDGWHGSTVWRARTTTELGSDDTRRTRLVSPPTGLLYGTAAEAAAYTNATDGWRWSTAAAARLLWRHAAPTAGPHVWPSFAGVTVVQRCIATRRARFLLPGTTGHELSSRSAKFWAEWTKRSTKF